MSANLPTRKSANESPGERRGAAVEREAAVGAEVVRHVVGAAAELAAKAELMRAMRPADRIRQLVLHREGSGWCRPC